MCYLESDIPIPFNPLYWEYNDRAEKKSFILADLHVVVSSAFRCNIGLKVCNQDYLYFGIKYI